MSVLTRPLIAPIVAIALSASCLGTAHATTVVTLTRLTEAEVVRIANTAAETKGYRIKDFKAPKLGCKLRNEDLTWTLFYEGKVPAFGDHFWVWVEDQTGVATVVPRQ